MYTTSASDQIEHRITTLEHQATRIEHILGISGISSQLPDNNALLAQNPSHNTEEVKELERKEVMADPKENWSSNVKRAMESCTKHHLGAVFKKVPSDYYNHSLEERRQILEAPSRSHLCKSLILENTKCTEDNWNDRKNSKYYCVIIQYTRRLSSEKLQEFLRNLNDRKIGKKKFLFRLAPEEINAKLSGYEKNGVTPLGMTEDIPIILSHHIAQLDPPFFWMGGGEVDVKLKVACSDFIRIFDPLVTDITTNEIEESQLDNEEL
eukprot:gb/GECH01001439.1/.p1 GENE.gb/GECH01001439.1/~~gb/GECH01001439.1/.p1  ORF type:complete len:266 (+),score=64.27 gb/GECH01001439.1/:1-798(+)